MAQVQNTTGPGSGGSGWVAPVPLPPAVVLLAVGLVALFGMGLVPGWARGARTPDL